MSFGVLGLKNDHSPSTKKFCEHLKAGNHHLIPKPSDMVVKQTELIIDWLIEGFDDPDHQEIYLKLVDKISVDMNEWLRVQIHNLRVADEIRRDI